VQFENRNYAFAGAFVDELARSGLKHVCICPGSRSAPLTISFARHADIRTWVHLDERSAAFFALGIARALREPVALVCSSGTATANFLPAIVEARYDMLPLMALTADRPSDVIDWGALQTIDQTRLYGSHPKWSVDMPRPEATTELMAYVRSLACRAYATAASAPAGPVHINIPFGDPLEPKVVTADFPHELSNLDEESWYGRADGRPMIIAPGVETRPRPEDVRRLVAGKLSVERGVIICGPQPDSALARVATDLGGRLGFPVLADALSQVRCGPHDKSLVIDNYDVFIRDDDIAASLEPEVVIRLGALPVSKPLTQYLERYRSAQHILVDESADWRDPFRITSQIWQLDPVAFCEVAALALEERTVKSEWSGRWLRLAEASREAADRQLGACDEMFEGKVFSELANLLPQEAVVFAGNSMPIRDMDAFFPSSDNPVQFMANRGASGIDGVVSTALGVAAASDERVVLVLGDISLYHDMNGLLAAKNHDLNATIIVLNNDGGGIFSFLPQAEHEEVFETYFGTPHGLTFQAAAEMYGLSYVLAKDWDRFREALRESLVGSGTTIIEVSGDRQRNVALHRQVWQAVSTGVRASEAG
jgi:2-succinyl-5-enolpyruvyl-6-hydroxy-3-cyclohexene-1-carboxylate synthase